MGSEDSMIPNEVTIMERVRHVFIIVIIVDLNGLYRCMLIEYFMFIQYMPRTLSGEYVSTMMNSDLHHKIMFIENHQCQNDKYND